MSKVRRYLTRDEVECYTGLSRSTIYRKMKEGTFPVPIQMADRAVRWRASDIRKYVNSRPPAQGEQAPTKKTPTAKTNPAKTKPAKKKPAKKKPAKKPAR